MSVEGAAMKAIQIEAFGNSAEVVKAVNSDLYRRI